MRFSASKALASTASRRFSGFVSRTATTSASAASRNCCARRAFPLRAATSAASSRPSAALRIASRSVPRASKRREQSLHHVSSRGGRVQFATFEKYQPQTQFRVREIALPRR